MKKRKILMGVLLSTLAASAISCGKKEETEPTKPVENFILNIIIYNNRRLNIIFKGY